ncbi:MAG: ABC transporter ATP-binding protein [Planctomycetota bacterium]
MIPISVRNVVKTFGAVRALDDVSLEVERGELFFLLGPSGCGKTTLLRIVAGFYHPERGQVRFGPVDVTRVPPQKRNTGMVFQNYALWPHMTVEANVAFGLKVRRLPRRDRRRRVAETLALVKMEAYARRKPNQLSGGQQQRVALARALVIRPQCLLLDEPLSNLDAKLRLEMRGEIRRLCKEFGLTAIYVTHDQKEALSIADRLAVLLDGRVAQVGSPRELYRRPATAAVADFLGETNFLPATVREAAGDRRAVETPIGVLAAASQPDAPRAGPCAVSIRPEAIRVSDADGSPDTLEGVVREIVYLGDTLQLSLAVGAATLRAVVNETSGQRPFRPGDPVRAAVDPRDVVVLPA